MTKRLSSLDMCQHCKERALFTHRKMGRLCYYHAKELAIQHLVEIKLFKRLRGLVPVQCTEEKKNARKVKQFGAVRRPQCTFGAKYFHINTKTGERHHYCGVHAAVEALRLMSDELTPYEGAPVKITPPEIEAPLPSVSQIPAGSHLPCCAQTAVGSCSFEAELVVEGDALCSGHGKRVALKLALASRAIDPVRGALICGEKVKYFRRDPKRGEQCGMAAKYLVHAGGLLCCERHAMRKAIGAAEKGE